jgi:hypothetical protein
MGNFQEKQENAKPHVVLMIRHRSIGQTKYWLLSAERLINYNHNAT